MGQSGYIDLWIQRVRSSAVGITPNSCGEGPEFESGHPREPVTNIRQTYISEAVIVGYTVYTHP